MTCKETIYTVDAKTNTILRVSRTYLAAIQYAATLKEGDVYTCTSVFQGLKKNDPIVDIKELL